MRDTLVSVFTSWGLPVDIVDKEPKINGKDKLLGELELPRPTGPISVGYNGYFSSITCTGSTKFTPVC
jgi:hypothetical protein